MKTRLETDIYRCLRFVRGQCCSGLNRKVALDLICKILTDAKIRYPTDRSVSKDEVIALLESVKVTPKLIEKYENRFNPAQ